MAEITTPPVSIGRLITAHGTITADTQTLDSTVTWNQGATTFTAWKLNVTNTASNAASKLIDLQVGGVSQFNVTRAGVLTATTLAGTLSTAAQPNVTSVGTLTSLTVSGSAAVPASITGTNTTTTFAINNTHANNWGGVFAIRQTGVDAGYFANLGALLGSTSARMVIWATAGNDIGFYTNGSSTANATISATTFAIASTTTAVQALTATSIAPSSDITMVNTAFLLGKNSTGTARQLIGVTAGNVVSIDGNALGATFGAGAVFAGALSGVTTLTMSGNLTLSGYGLGGGLVSVGAADSGGAGFKLLRVPN